MRIDILTLFPEMFDSVINTSIIKRAIRDDKIKINLINIRDFSTLNNSQVDDTIYGGGAGMLMMIEPVVLALESVLTKDSFVILTEPSGKTFNQSIALSLKDKKHIIIICGHYEGIDARIKYFIHQKISLGNFIMTGGEITAMAIIDSVTRLVKDVISEESLINESFNDKYLDYESYTKPRNFRGYQVPEVLLSGNHALIEKYRQENRIERTIEERGDLLYEN